MKKKIIAILLVLAVVGTLIFAQASSRQQRYVRCRKCQETYIQGTEHKCDIPDRNHDRRR